MIRVKHPLLSCYHAQNAMINRLPMGIRHFYGLLFSYSNASYLYHTEAKLLPEFIDVSMEEYIKLLMGSEAFELYFNLLNEGFLVNKSKREIHKKDRAFILSRDGYKCLKPGCYNITDLTIDHIVPIVHGGDNEIENYQTLCEKHNNEKGTLIIDYRFDKSKSLKDIR